MKKLYRSSENRMIAGVCGGLAEYLELDPSLVRLVFCVLSILGAGGFFVVLYVAIMLIVPVSPGPAGQQMVNYSSVNESVLYRDGTREETGGVVTEGGRHPGGAHENGDRSNESVLK